MDRWKCNLCKTGVVNTELAIRNHCAIYHHVNERYKCCLCNFSGNEKDLVIAHMNEKHESVSQVVISMYKEVSSVEFKVAGRIDYRVFGINRLCVFFCLFVCSLAETG